MSVIVISTTNIPDGLSDIYKHWIYNGLDCCVTREVIHKQRTEVKNYDDDCAQKIFEFEMGQRPLVLEMMMRGIRIDPVEHSKLLRKFEDRKEKLTAYFDRVCEALTGKTYLATSPQQLLKLFYTDLGLPPVTRKDKTSGRIRPTTDREALEQLSKKHRQAKILVTLILGIREAGKMLGSLRAGVDPDGRMRFSFNPSATETGRWSSSKNVYKRGLNAQNQTEEVRSMFIADPGYKLCYADLKQAESFGVGYISGDKAYIEACESGDLHTAVCQLIWPDLEWTGNLVKDREIAEQPFYRHFSRRDIAKRAGHATNYKGSAWTLSRVLRVDQDVLERFQRAYFDAFPGIYRWHLKVQVQLQRTATIVTQFGRKRQFFGRPYDDSTLREAIAFEPQSIVADLLNKGLVEAWYWVPEAQILMQVHDAGLFQYPEDRPELMTSAAKHLQVPLEFPCGTMRIPVDLECGYRWVKNEMAPLGSAAERAQVRPTISLLDTVF